MNIYGAPRVRIGERWEEPMDDDVTKATTDPTTTTLTRYSEKGRGQTPEVWAVVQIDYDDYPVGQPLSYHWTEAGAIDWIQANGPHHRKVRRKKIAIDGDPPATGGGDNEHLAAIRETLESGNEWGCLPTEHFVVIEHHAEALAADSAALRARLAETEEQLRLCTIDQANTEAELAEAEDSRNRWRRAAWDTSPDGFDELIRAGEVVRVDHPSGLSYGFREIEPGDLPDAEGGDGCPHGQPWDDCPDCRH